MSSRNKLVIKLVFIAVARLKPLYSYCNAKKALDVELSTYTLGNNFTLLKMGCYITPLGHYTILVIKNFKENNQYGVVPQGCNLAPHF